MEIKFNETSCYCLRRAADQLQVREQTQEVRLPDAMPDIGKVLGCWGQPIIRGKEWRSDSMSVSGGVMAWVLYAPEDGSQLRTLESWIPFQLKWELPETERDGFIWAAPYLKSMDARSTSARKLMVRANISIWGQALEGVDVPVFYPELVPEDVQLRTASYPMELPREAGEKLFSIEEELTVPNTCPPVENLLRYEMRLQIQEQKVMASRLVFRGKALLHILYGSEGALHTWDWEVPFSQFADLDRDHSANASARIMPVLTDLELEMAENGLQLKAGAAAQYVIHDRTMVDVVEDAYSPLRDVQAQARELKLPMVLDRTEMGLRAEHSLRWDGQTVVDVCWMPDHLQRQQNGDIAELILPGQFQILYRDDGGAPQCSIAKYEKIVQLPADGETVIDGFISPDGPPQYTLRGEELELSAPLQLEAAVSARAAQTMLSGLDLGELRQPDPGRPSMILRRCDDSSLWNLAKACGSTVEAIQRANGLEKEPEHGQMLLIPVC